MKNFCKIFIYLFILFYSIKSIAQQTVFSKSYYEQFSSISSSQTVQAFDKGYILTGINGNGGFVLKVDSSGNYLWSKGFGNIGFYDVSITNDSCFILTGYCPTGLFWTKIDSNGSIIWSKSMMGGGPGIAVEQTNDNGFIITGYYGYPSLPTNVVILKIDSTGNILWQKVLELGDRENIGYSIKQLSDSSYIVAVYTESEFYYKNYLLNLSPSGNILWANEYKSNFSALHLPLDVEITPNGLLFFFSEGGALLLTKVDFNGNIIWSVKYNSGLSAFCVKCAMPQINKTSDGNFVIVSGVSFTNNLYSSDIIKIDTAGNVMWHKNLVLDAVEAIESKDKGFFIIGNGRRGSSSNIQIGIIKTDSLGNSNSCTLDTVCGFTSITVSATPVIFSVVSGEVQNGITPVTYTLFFGSNNGCVDFVGIEENIIGNNINIYPNPATNEITIETKEEGIIYIYNMLGEIITKMENTMTGSVTINVSSFANGMYFINIQTEKGMVRKKFVKE